MVCMYAVIHNCAFQSTVAKKYTDFFLKIGAKMKENLSTLLFPHVFKQLKLIHAWVLLIIVIELVSLSYYTPLVLSHQRPAS